MKSNLVRNAAIIVLAVLLIAGGALWMSGAPIGGFNSQAPQVRASIASEDKLLSPNVVTTASKLGQGRVAVPGLPVAEEYVLPSLRDRSVGLALLIPGGDLPATAKHQELATLPDSTSAELRFDMYSWSMGTLAATTPEPFAIGASHPDVPEPLMELARGADHSQRLMLVLPAGAAGDSQQLPALLNKHDAYVIVAEIRLSTGR